MSDRSTILSLPYIQPSQAQKHVTHNEALQQLDAIVQLAVVSADLNAPPALPDAGARYIVAPGAVSGWLGQDNKVALWTGNGWAFYAPVAGWRADVLATGIVLRFDGATWVDPQVGALQNVAHVGIATTADDTNRLSVAADATLLNHAGASHQLKINKDQASDTASLLFQTGFGGRAEMGIAGNDDFSVKVSPDGTGFRTALAVDAADGAVQFPQGQCYFEDVFVADDTAYGFDIPFADPARILMWLSADAAGHAYLIALTGVLSGAANFGAVFMNPPGGLNFLSGALGGTTGPNGAINMSIDDSGPTKRMYLENRLGTDRTFTM